MVFSSLEFLALFLPTVVIIYFLLNSKGLYRVSNVWLVIASLYFYAFWNDKYLGLILCSIFINFLLSKALNKTINKKSIRLYLLLIGIIFNILLLGYFKYTNFLITSINLTFDKNFNLLNIILPLAISFFTFQQISFLVDVYKNNIKEYSFINYILFISFFPQLIAGPIVHHKEMMPQFASKINKKINWDNMNLGLYIFSIGLFKKVMLADALSVWVNKGFDNPNNLNFYEAWLTSLSYTFQLYFDFSGYANMAIGIALLFNIKLPINFNSPYKALNIQDFWRRWHITLSRFMKNYIYIPLGGNKVSKKRTLINIFIVAFISGIWHGANFTFIIWGALHGIALVFHRIYSSILGFKMHKYIGWFITFIFINCSWVIFRSENIDKAKVLLSKMFYINDFTILFTYKFDKLWLQFIIISLIIVIFLKNQNNAKKGKAFITIILLYLSINFMTRFNEFLYFQF